MKFLWAIKTKNLNSVDKIWLIKVLKYRMCSYMSNIKETKQLPNEKGQTNTKMIDKTMKTNYTTTHILQTSKQFLLHQYQC